MNWFKSKYEVTKKDDDYKCWQWFEDMKLKYEAFLGNDPKIKDPIEKSATLWNDLNNIHSKKLELQKLLGSIINGTLPSDDLR